MPRPRSTERHTTALRVVVEHLLRARKRWEAMPKNHDPSQHDNADAVSDKLTELVDLIERLYPPSR